MSVAQPLPIGFVSFVFWKLPPLALPRVLVHKYMMQMLQMCLYDIFDLRYLKHVIPSVQSSRTQRGCSSRARAARPQTESQKMRWKATMIDPWVLRSLRIGFPPLFHLCFLRVPNFETLIGLLFHAPRNTSKEIDPWRGLIWCLFAFAK